MVQRKNSSCIQSIDSVDKFPFAALHTCIILADFLWFRYHFGGLTHEKKQSERAAFLFYETEKEKGSKGFEQGGSIRRMRKKTVRWTVFAEGATSEARR